jgi:hypothetical protein
LTERLTQQEAKKTYNSSKEIIMFRTTLLACFTALLLLALPAAATAPSWDISPGSYDGKCSFDRYDICFSDFDDDVTTPILDTRKCENYSVHFISDTLDTTYDTTINIRWSNSATVSANTSEVVDNLTLTGNPAAGLDVLAGYDAPWIYADIVNHETADVARIAVQCWKRRW